MRDITEIICKKIEKWSILRLWTEECVWISMKVYSRNGNFQEKRRANLRGSSRCRESEWPTIKLLNTRDCTITRTKSCKFKANPRVDLLATSRTSSSADLSCIVALLKDQRIIASCSILIIGLFPMVLQLTSTQNDHWSIMERELEHISRIIVKVRTDYLNFSFWNVFWKTNIRIKKMKRRKGEKKISITIVRDI